MLHVLCVCDSTVEKVYLGQMDCKQLYMHVHVYACVLAVILQPQLDWDELVVPKKQKRIPISVSFLILVCYLSYMLYLHRTSLLTWKSLIHLVLSTNTKTNFLLKYVFVKVFTVIRIELLCQKETPSTFTLSSILK